MLAALACELARRGLLPVVHLGRQLRVDEDALREEESDLSFAEFGDPKRPYTAPALEGDRDNIANSLEELARREGLEPPTLRFEDRSRRKK